MSGISTHVLDVGIGRPAGGIRVILERRGTDNVFTPVGSGTTGEDGRIGRLQPNGARLLTGTYRITFDTHSYFESRQLESFYPEVSVVFTLRDPSVDYHLPLLLSPFGYSTYRGS